MSERNARDYPRIEKRGFNGRSEANFVVIKCPIDQARFIFEALKLRNILIKCLTDLIRKLKIRCVLPLVRLKRWTPCN